MIKNKSYQLLLVSVILLVILTSAINLTFDSFNKFYNNNKDIPKQPLAKVSDNIYNFYPVKVFSSYTGFDTGYGFFGPNVSSDFVLLFAIYNEQGELIKNEKFELSSKEGSLRFISLNSMFLEQITKTSNIKFDKYVAIILKQITKYIAKKFPKNFTVITQLYLYDFPSINNFRSGKKVKLYLIKDTLWKN